MHRVRDAVDAECLARVSPLLSVVSGRSSPQPLSRYTVVSRPGWLNIDLRMMRHETLSRGRVAQL